MKIKNAKLKPEQKECLKLENPTDYIIQHYDNFSTRNGYNCIVMSSEENVQDLADYIENTDLTTIYKNAFPILNQLLTGVAYLHCINIAHTDIKPENIIVHLTSRRKPAIKIIDFDLALDLSIGPKQPMHCRTLGYCSPETFTPATVYEFFSNPPIIDLIKTDSWSIAATMRTYIDNLNPYGERLLANGAVSAMTYVDTRDIILKVLKENKHNYTPIHIPPHLINYADTFGIPDLMDFLEDLMMPNPKDRFTPIRTLQESVPYYKQFILPFAVSKMQH
ncbi:kinase-like domain-containing protein [Syncephalis fuscata]|nr:kinase-like domain-containing protein [Syncephalis fuscata]